MTETRDRWPGRLAIVATLVEDGLETGARVLDVGCGSGALAGHLPPGCAYTGLDRPAFDMDTDEWPAGFDIGVLAGTLEYSRAPARVLAELRRTCRRAVVTYAHGGRREAAWNDLTPRALRALFAAVGFAIEAETSWRAPHLRPQAVYALR